MRWSILPKGPPCQQGNNFKQRVQRVVSGSHERQEGQCRENQAQLPEVVEKKTKTDRILEFCRLLDHNRSLSFAQPPAPGHFQFRTSGMSAPFVSI